MTQLTWADTGQRYFFGGVDRGVLFLQNGSGIPWNGLVSVEETPSGSDLTVGYYDGTKYFSRRKPESFSATIRAFYYPDEFEPYDGFSDYVSGQARPSFGFSYRTLIGDDVEALGENYLIHIVYNAMASPSKRNNNSNSDGASANLFSWDIETTPELFEGRSGSHLTIDTRYAYPWAIHALEALLYGNESSDGRLPSAQEVIDLFENASILRITDHGDGTWTAEGPDEAFEMLDATTFQITWPSAIYIDGESYLLSSL